MTHQPELQQRLLELIYGVLSEEETAELRHRIATEQDVALAMAEAERTAALWKRAARFEVPRIPLVRPIGSATAPQGVASFEAALSQSAATAPAPPVHESPVHESPGASSGRPRVGRASPRSLSAATARAGWRRWSQWTVGSAASLLMLVSLGGYAYYRGELSELAAEHVRLRVTGPAQLQLAGPNRFDIATTDLDGHPLATQVQVTLVGSDGHTLLSQQEPTDTAGLLHVALPRNIKADARKADARVSLQIVASYGSLSERFETPLPVFPEPLVTCVASDRPAYTPGQTLRCRSLTLSAVDRAVDRECAVRFSLIDAGGRPVAGATAEKSTSRGVAAAEFVVPAGMEPGVYALAAASPDGSFPASHVPIAIEPLHRPSLLADVELLRDSYSPGGKVVAHLAASRPDGSPVANVKFQAVAQVDGKDAYRTAGETSSTGTQQLSFALPQQVAKADAQLTVTLDDAGRKIQTTRRLLLEQPKVATAFFPEGGSLVAGLPNRVYFTARDSRGYAVSMSGQVVDSQGRVVALIETSRDGMGTFLLEPAADEPYRVRIERPAGVGDTPKLPPVAADRGVVLNAGLAVYEPGKPIEFNVRSTEENLPLVAAVACRNVLVGQQAFLGHRKSAGVVVNLDDDVAGVLQLTLYDYRNSPPKPVAERWVFRRPSRWLTVRCTPQEPRDAQGRATIEVAVADEQNRPVQATLGATVVGYSDAVPPTATGGASLPACFLLAGMTGVSADLESARSYLSDDPQAWAGLDLFLGTHRGPQLAELAAASSTRPLETPVAAEAWSPIAASATAAVAAPLRPPIMFDNLADLQARYRENILAWNTHRARVLNIVITVSLFGAIGLVLYMTLLALMNIPTGPRLWVPSLGVASVCLVLGVFLLNPQRHPTGTDGAIAFARYLPAEKPVVPEPLTEAEKRLAENAPLEAGRGRSEQRKDREAEQLLDSSARGSLTRDSLAKERLNRTAPSDRGREESLDRLEEKAGLADNTKQDAAASRPGESDGFDVLESAQQMSESAPPRKVIDAKQTMPPTVAGKPAFFAASERTRDGSAEGLPGIRPTTSGPDQAGGVSTLKTPSPSAAKAAPSASKAAPSAAPAAAPAATLEPSVTAVPATPADAPAPAAPVASAPKGAGAAGGYGAMAKDGAMPVGKATSSPLGGAAGRPMPTRGGVSAVGGAGDMPGSGQAAAEGGMSGMGGGLRALQQKKDDRKPSDVAVDVAVKKKGVDLGVAGRSDEPNAIGALMQPAKPAAATPSAPATKPSASADSVSAGSISAGSEPNRTKLPSIDVSRRFSPEEDRLKATEQEHLFARTPKEAEHALDYRHVPTLPYWSPSAQTDSQGKSVFAFSTTSKASSYRVTVDAHTADGRLGAAVETFNAPPSILAQYAPARHPSQFAIRDGNAAIDADRKRKVAAMQMQTQAIQRRSFVANADKSAPMAAEEVRTRLLPNLWDVPWDVDQAKALARLAKSQRFEAKAESGGKGAAAGEFVSGYFRTHVVGGRANAATEFRLAAPADAVPGTVHASVIVEPSVIATALRALDALLAEPDDSFESAVARMQLASLALQAMVERSAAQPALVRQLKAVLHEAYAYAAQRECPEQGFHWFGKDRGDVLLTGLGLAAFSQTATWYDIDQGQAARNARWLARRIETDVAGSGSGSDTKPGAATVSTSPSPTSRRHPGRDLATADKAGDKAGGKAGGKAADKVGDIEAQWGYMASRLVAGAGPSAEAPRLGLAALAALETDRQADARDLLRRLLALQADDGSLRGDVGLFAQPGSDSARIERTALALAGWSRLPEFTAPARRAADWLLQHRCASGLFGPPIATALAVRGWIQLDRGSPVAAGNRTVQIRKGETVLAQRPIPVDGLRPVLIADLADHLGAGDSRFSIRTDAGPGAYQAVVSWQTAKPDDDPRCSLRLSVALTDAKVRAGQTVDLAVELTNASESALPAAVVRIGLPPGFTLSDEQRAGLESVGSVDACRVQGRQLWFYRQSLAPKQKLAWRLQLRATASSEPVIPGKQTGAPSTAFLYDTPEQRRWAAPLSIEIVP